jgi:hypothetical protein
MGYFAGTVDVDSIGCQFFGRYREHGMSMAPKRRQPNEAKRMMDGNDASLYPLDAETAIKAIMDAGPHPREDSSANRSRTTTQRRKSKTQKRS